TGLSPAGTGGHRLDNFNTDDTNAPAKLTLQLDHPVGAGHGPADIHGRVISKADCDGIARRKRFG
ncbi:MAG: hypothetical protein ACREV7_21325, partial [Steroidobacteraceae bacterium]